MGIINKPTKILMVDDVERFQLIYKMAIKDEFPESEVEFSINGFEALEKMENDHFDLVILDLNMPKLNGENTLIRLKTEKKYHNIPIIVLTGESNPQVKQRLLGCGAHDFIEKGADPDVFVGRINAALNYKILIEELSDIAINNNLFATGILHDIKNLESNITSICHIVKIELSMESEISNELKSKLEEELLHLREQANRLGDYARNIIEMIRNKDEKIKSEPVDIGPIINWAYTLLLPRNTKLALEVGELEPVIGQAEMMKVTIFNIIQNSLKFNQENLPVIKVFQKNVGQKVVTFFEDNGPGVREQEYSSVFKQFSKGSEVENTGHGLGLSLVSRAVSLMGGEVWAEKPIHMDQGFMVALSLPKPE